MTKSLTPPVLPSAGANSKPHDYKQKYKKMKDLSKTWVLTGKQFEDLTEKRTKTKFSTFQKYPVEHTSGTHLNATIE